MKSILLRIFAFGILIFAVQSCALYLPQPASIPLMSTQNEAQFNGGVTLYGGLNASAAYSPGQHVAIQAYGSVHPSNIYYAQGALGYYTKTKSNINFEIYGGYGGGKGSAFDFENYDSLAGKYSLYYIQANIGQTDIGSLNFDYGLGIKTGIFNTTMENYSTLYPVNDLNNTLLIEPQIFMRMGGEKLKFGMQINATEIVNLENNNSIKFYYPFNCALSINYRIAPPFKSRNQKIN